MSLEQRVITLERSMGGSPPEAPPGGSYGHPERWQQMSDDLLEIWVRLADLIHKNSGTSKDAVPEAHWQAQWWWIDSPLHQFLRGGPYKAWDGKTPDQVITPPRLNAKQMELLMEIIEQHLNGPEPIPDEVMLSRIVHIVL